MHTDRQADVRLPSVQNDHVLGLSQHNDDRISCENDDEFRSRRAIWHLAG